MTTNPGRPRRRRGRRGQRSQQGAPQLEQQVAEAGVAEVEAEPIVAEARPPAHDIRDNRGGRDEDDTQAGRQGDAARKRARPRRRPNNRRQATVGPMPSEVLKARVRHVPPTGTVSTRSLDEFGTPGGMTFGCPMLSRTRIGMPFANGQRAPRCSMGWALHGEDEAMFCMRTPDLLDCWKEHPEREAELRASQEAEHAAD